MRHHDPPEVGNHPSTLRVVTNAEALSKAQFLRELYWRCIPPGVFMRHSIADWYVAEKLRLPETNRTDYRLENVFAYLTVAELRGISLQLDGMLARERARRYPYLHGIRLVLLWRAHTAAKAIRTRVAWFMKRR